jgi:sugar lactone lactonase YvrE
MAFLDPPRTVWPLALLLLSACTSDKGSDTSGDDGGSSDGGTTDGGTTDGGTSDGGTADGGTADGGSDSGGDGGSGDTGTTVETFESFTDDPDLLEIIDVAVDGEDGVYVTGFNLAGEAGVWYIDSSGSAASEVYTGDPLIQPTGLALSSDGGTLYLSDLGVVSPSELMNGAVYSLDVGGGPLTELGAADTIDLPGDVALIHGGGGVYVSGMDEDGSPALFTVAGGAADIVASGGSLVDPTAIAVSPDGSWVIVVDSLASDGKAAILAFEVPGYSESILAEGFQVAFPGGVATDSASVWFTRVDGPSLYEMSIDGSAMTVTDTMGLMELPGSLGLGTDQLYVTELAHNAGSDLYLLSY